MNKDSNDRRLCCG